MGFRESKNKLGVRVRSAFNKLKHSKSIIGSSNLMNREMSMLRAVSPMPLPVLTLPIGLSHRLAASTLFDSMMRDSIMFLEPRSLIKSPDDQATDQSPANVLATHSSTTPNKVLKREGLLESPISLRLASLIKCPAELRLPTPLASSPLIHPGLLRSHKSGPFTPELLITPTEVTPEYTTSFTTPDADGEFSKTEPLVEQLPSRASSPISVYSQKSYTAPSTEDKDICITPENPASRAVNVNVAPVRQFLRRRGPIPTTQPLSCRLLQSIMSSKTDESLSAKSACTSSESNADFSDYLEQLCPGGGPMDQYVLDDAESEPVLLANTTEPLRILCRPLSRRSSLSSVSTFMTDVTGYLSNSSLD
ncbi:hypothetical protein DFH28DRAFT_1061877 [Melampsora americana]|nr:hypothetical protein DFH28DRAFT_1061877 [Melampsora americana]